MLIIEYPFDVCAANLPLLYHISDILPGPLSRRGHQLLPVVLSSPRAVLDAGRLGQAVAPAATLRVGDRAHTGTGHGGLRVEHVLLLLLGRGVRGENLVLGGVGSLGTRELLLVPAGQGSGRSVG